MKGIVVVKWCLCLLFISSFAFSGVDSDELFVQTKLKNAILAFDSTVGNLRNPLQLGQIKKTFTLLLDAPAEKLFLFIDLEILDSVLPRLESDLVLPIHKQRLALMSQLLRASANHPLVPKIFKSYKDSTRAMYRKDTGGTGLHYAIGRGLERMASEETAEIFGFVRDLIDTREILLDPLQIFRMAQNKGLTLAPTRNISAWHETLLEIEPKLFSLANEAQQEFFYPQYTRKIFTNPDYLYQYLSKKDPHELPSAAREFIATYEKSVPESFQRIKTLTAKQWSYLYDELRHSHPELLRGVFSLPENKIFFEFYNLMEALNQNHILFCAELFSKASQESPQELTAAIKYILRKQPGFTNSEVQTVSVQQFMQWLNEGRIPYFEYALKKIKMIREILTALEQHILKLNSPMDDDTLLWAQNAVEKSLGHMEDMWKDLDLRLVSIDDTQLQGGLTPKNVEQIMLTRHLVGKIFGENYVLSLKALRTHLRYVIQK